MKGFAVKQPRSLAGIPLVVLSLLLSPGSALSAPDAPVPPAVPAQLSVGSVPPPATTAEKSHQHGYILPFTSSPTQGAPLITVWLNGRIESTFIVDTGTGNCLISKSLAAKLDLTPYPALLSDGKPLYFNGLQPQAVTLTSLKIGGKDGPLTIQPLTGPVLIVADSQLRTLAGATVEGMIGSNLLDSFAVEFGFPDHTMMLIYPGSLTIEESGSLGFNGPGETILPLYRREDETYSVPVRLKNGKVSRTLVLLVDTAGQWTTIPRNIAQQLSVTPLGERPVFSLGDSKDDGRLHTYSTEEAQVDTLGLGDLQFTKPYIRYSVTDKNDHLAGLGLDVLSGYKVLMDFPARKMYLQTPVMVAPPVQVKPSTPKRPQAP